MTLVQVLQRLPLLLIAALAAGAEEQESLTSPNARLVKDLRTGVAPDSSYALPVDVGDGTSELLYFWADDGLHGREPWTSDGTDDGLRMLGDICPGPCSSQVTSVEATNRSSRPSHRHKAVDRLDVEKVHIDGGVDLVAERGVARHVAAGRVVHDADAGVDLQLRGDLVQDPGVEAVALDAEDG